MLSVWFGIWYTESLVWYLAYSGLVWCRRNYSMFGIWYTLFLGLVLYIARLGLGIYLDLVWFDMNI